MIDVAVYGGLDEAFPMTTLSQVAAWVDLCLAPRNTDIVYPDYQIDNTTERDGAHHGLDSTPVWDNRPPDLPMAGVSPEDFFRAARAVSALDQGAFEQVYDVFVNAAGDMQNVLIDNGRPAPPDGSNPHGNARDRSPDGGPGGAGDRYQPPAVNIGAFTGTMDDIFAHWEGEARDACKRYVDQLTGVMDVLVRNAWKIAVLISMYWAGITASRTSLKSAMDDFNERMHQKEAADAAAAIKRQITEFTTLMDAGKSVLKMETITATTVGKLLTGEVGKWVKNALKDDKGNGSGSYSGIASDYLHRISDEISKLHQSISTDVIEQCAQVEADLGNSNVRIADPQGRDYDVTKSVDAHHDSFQPTD